MAGRQAAVAAGQWTRCDSVLTRARPHFHITHPPRSGSLLSRTWGSLQPCLGPRPQQPVDTPVRSLPSRPAAATC